jgi:hypothetical protein
MSNRRFQLALTTLAQGQLSAARAVRLLNLIVISIVIVVAIIQSPLADWAT